MAQMIQNPVLPGFHPDPSILRVGEWFYLATSTFEWWPGIRVHRSRDLVHWEHCCYPLDRPSQLDMVGNPDSCGIWAPCLTHHRGTFYLVFTNVRTLAGAYKDTPNYFVTAPAIEGPWSEPIYLNSSGFDPSFYHEGERTWLVNMEWSHRLGDTPFSGILLQEYSHAEQRLVGPIKRIFKGSERGLVEGPHIYKHEARYYLMVAEGGTGYEHAVTVARCDTLDGDYELSPYHPLITSLDKPEDRLQRAGHGSLVEAAPGQWYVAHLCGRPIEWQGAPARAPLSYERKHCVLGRETALQKVEWTADGWLRCSHGDNAPAWQVPAPSLPPAPVEKPAPRDDFDGPVLAADFNSLRVPFDESWVSLKARPGFLRIVGRESLMSFHRQSLVMRRQQHFKCVAETLLEFAPASFQQMAGLLAYYNTQNHAYLCLSCDPDSGERILMVLGNDHGIYQEWSKPVAVGAAQRVWMRVRFDVDRFSFEYALAPGAWQSIGPLLPAAMLSDEHATVFDGDYARTFGFTGNYIGMACQDLTGRQLHADFDYFTYQELV